MLSKNTSSYNMFALVKSVNKWNKNHQFLNVVIKMGLSIKIKWTNITKSRFKSNIFNFRIRFYFDIKQQTKED